MIFAVLKGVAVILCRIARSPKVTKSGGGRSWDPSRFSPQASWGPAGFHDLRWIMLLRAWKELREGQRFPRFAREGAEFEDMDEIEAKFLLRDEREIDRLNAWIGSRAGVPVPELDIVDRYFDSRDWDIFAGGWTYRWREADGKREVGLKSVDGGGEMLQKRTEIGQPVTSFPGRKHGLDSGRAADLLDKLGPGELRELFRVYNRRRRMTLTPATGSVIEVSIDHVVVRAVREPIKLAPGELRFNELELELKEGDEEVLTRLAAEVQERFGLQVSRLGKFDRGLQAAGLMPPARLRPEVCRIQSAWGDEKTRRSRRSRWTKRDSAASYARHYLREQFQCLLIEEPKAWEGLDVEGVHRMRVSTRRLRAGLHAFRDVLPEADRKHFEKELKWLAGVLGRVRDLDVLIGSGKQFASGLSAEHDDWIEGFRDGLIRRWRVRRRDLVACLSGDRYARLESELGALLGNEFGGEGISISESAGRALGNCSRRLRKEGRRISADSPDREVHKLRLDCKRMRYLLEIYRPVLGESIAKNLRKLKKLQDVLGGFQDACVAAEELRHYADRIPLTPGGRSQLLGTGAAIGNQREQAAARRADFHKAWVRFDRKGWRKELLRASR